MNKPRRLKVLRISHSAAVSAYRDRDRALSEMDDLDVALISPTSWQHLGGGSVEASESFPVTLVNTIGTGSVPLFAFQPLPIRKALLDFKPDLVDIHEEPYSVSCIESVLLTKRYAPQAAMVFYSAQNIKKRYPFPFSWSEPFVYSQTHGAYPCSIGVQEVLQRKGFRQPSPVIPLGIRPELYSPDGPRLNVSQCTEETFLIGFSGRIESYKGIEWLLQAVRKLAQQFTPQQLKLAIVGNGSHTKEFKSMAQEFGVSSYVHWLGELRSTEMPAFYRTCNVLAVPSLTTAGWREQFGRVPVESMACGTPVIVSDSGSLPEVVPEDAGRVVAEGDVNALAGAIHHMIVDAAGRRALIARGLQLVEERYTWKRVADAMHDLYLQAYAIRHPRSVTERAPATTR